MTQNDCNLRYVNSCCTCKNYEQDEYSECGVYVSCKLNPDLCIRCNKVCDLYEELK